MKKQFSQMGLPISQVLEEVSVENYNMAYLVDKKTFLPISYTSSFDMTIEGAKINMAMEWNFSKINKIKEIKLPKEAQNAQEVQL